MPSPTKAEIEELERAAEDLTDSVKDMMVHRLSRLKQHFKGENPVKPKLRSCSDKVKRDAGKLKQFMDMPLDIFLEVAGSIEPLDLLCLSRVNKEFRATFMSRSSRFVWTRVLDSVPGLPSCPPDLTEPQYASLIFEQLCSACDSVRTSRVHFSLRVRLCTACTSVNLRRGQTIHPYPAWPFEESVYHFLPSNFVYSTRTTFANNQRNQYLVSELQLVVEDCRALQNNIPALQKYMRDRQIMATAIMQHGTAVYLWYRDRQRDAWEVKQDFFAQRRNKIYTKLKTLGWDVQYYPTSEYLEKNSLWFRHGRSMDREERAWYSLIHQPKELTERSWKTLRPKLKGVYERIKQQKLAGTSLPQAEHVDL